MHQSKSDIELILVDDGSTDNSYKICKRYKKEDERIILVHQENKGVIKARAKGIEISSADYITFIDADDFIDEESFIYANPYMEKRIDIICFGVKRYLNGRTTYEDEILESGVYRGVKLEHIKKNMIWDDARNRYGIDISIWNKVFKKELLIKVYKELKQKDFFYGEDIAAVISAVGFASSLAICEKAYYNHRLRAYKHYGSYFTDNYFYEKIVALYRFLIERFPDDPEKELQSEKVMLNGIRYRQKSLYDIDDALEIKYMFPFDRVEKGSRIVLYGAGTVGKAYFKELSMIDYCQVILWIDENPEAENIKPVQEIQKVNYDKVIIAVKRKDYINQIAYKLDILGVAKEKVII